MGGRVAAEEQETTRTVAVSGAVHDLMKRHLAKYHHILGRRKSLGQYATEAIQRLVEHDLAKLKLIADLERAFEGEGDADALDVEWGEAPAKERNRSTAK